MNCYELKLAKYKLKKLTVAKLKIKLKRAKK